MIDGIVGIVLKLNPVNEDLETRARAPGRLTRIKQYLRTIKMCERYNVPKKKGNPGYKYLQPGQWLMLYDPIEEAITAVGKVIDQKHDDNNPDFPCYNSFDHVSLWFPRKYDIPLSLLESVFGNFRRSRRYRNLSKCQFDKLMRRARRRVKEA